MTEDALKIDAEKTAFNARAKASMREYLKSRTWPEKIESIERMNEAARPGARGDAKNRNQGNKVTREREAGWVKAALSQARYRDPSHPAKEFPVHPRRKKNCSPGVKFNLAATD